MRRVVVTGIGAVTPVGNTFRESWTALLEGRSGIGPITRFDASSQPWQAAGELKNFRPEDFVPVKDSLRLDRFVQYAAAASVMAVEDAAIAAGALKNAAVVIGSSRGGIGSIESAVMKRATAYLMAGSTVSMAASYVSQTFGVRGHVLGISNACSSGANAVGEAMRFIREGRADIAIAGGAEAPLTPVAVEGYGIAGALSKSGVMSPFDRKRDGFVLSEGAAVLVLEDFEAAIKRGARVYGTVLGYGNTSDAFHMTVPDGNSQARAMRSALDYAGIKPKDVVYINAHATATPTGDRIEAESILKVYGAGIPVSATKSLTGHMLGASGAFEAAVTVMSLFEGVIHPSANLTDPDCELEHVIEARKAGIGFAVSNSFGFGGVNAVLVFGRTSD